jgi:hypothetical protein
MEEDLANALIHLVFQIQRLLLPLIQNEQRSSFRYKRGAWTSSRTSLTISATKRSARPLCNEHRALSFE